MEETEIPQAELAQSVPGASDFIDRVLGLFSDELLLLAGLMLLGSIVGVATTSGFRTFLPKPAADEKHALAHWNLMMPRVAFCFGAGWTFFIVWQYMASDPPAPLVMTVLVSFAAAVCSGAITPWSYDMLKAAGRATVGGIGGWIKRKMGGGGNQP